MPCTHNCHQGRACTCTPPRPTSLYPPFLSGFFFGAAAALTFVYFLLP